MKPRKKASSRKAADWLKKNVKAIAEYNRRVAARGVFSNGLRRF